MSSDLASVTDFAAARARRSVKARRRDRESAGYNGDEMVKLAREPLTVILQASNVLADAEVHRHIGINDAMKLVELRHVLEVCFGLPSEESPWHFFTHDNARGERINPQRQVSEVLWKEGDQMDFTWGLWDFTLVVADIYPRDSGTPQALCVGGSGSFPGTSFDITDINAELTGQETITQVLAGVREEVRHIIEKTRLLDFVPLLKAMDVARPGGVVAAGAQQVLASLPREVTTQGQDALWSMVLALSCMGGDELADEVAATTMDALGWVDDDGAALSAGEIRRMCAASLEQLEAIGACGPNAVAPVDRLDIFRALLRRQ